MAGKAGVLQSMGFQRVRHNGTTRRLKLFYIQEVGSVRLGGHGGNVYPRSVLPSFRFKATDIDYHTVKHKILFKK